jgi:dolichol-phosphate mannosyltransferase
VTDQSTIAAVPGLATPAVPPAQRTPAADERTGPANGGRAPDERAPSFCLVVPTRNEADNVEPLLRRLDEALRGMSAEVIFVDDSDDDTFAAIERARDLVELRVRVHQRPHGARPGRLGGAVIAGLRLCDAPYAIVLDGDLQHPPEVVPRLCRAATTKDVDVIVGSRYVDDGSAAGLANGARRAISSGANVLARLVFPRRLRGITDVMSGFFLIRMSALRLDELEADGYKILMEILLTGRRLRVAEEGYTFAERHAGSSNASMTEGLRFGRRLFALRTPRPARYALVGASGLIPNLVGTWALDRAGLHYLISAIIATQVAVAWNFAGCELLVWENFPGSRRRRYLPFAFVNSLDLLLRLPALAFLVGRWHLGVATATFITLLMAVVLRFLLMDKIVYRRSEQA